MRKREIFFRLLDASLVARGRAALGERLAQSVAAIEEGGEDPYAELVRLLGEV
jgi:hypothetical protein